MTIIVFLIDTSASMNQRAYLGGRPTMIDVAKGAVETFVKVRQRAAESRGDRYMLLTFDEPPTNIKAGWKENLATFMTELKNLHSTSLTSMGAALKQTFDVLNINRMQTGIDTYGQGRCPYYLEPSVIVVITDGGKLSSMQGVQEDFNLPMHTPIPGSELTREPFRWDQRLFALVLRMAGTPCVERDTGLVPSDNSPIDAMCEVTGGRSYCITSHRMLLQCIDSLVQKVHSGVVINFEKIGPDPPPIGNDGIKSDIELLLDGGEGTEDSMEMLPLPGGVPSRPQTPTTGPQPSLGSLGTAWHTCRRLIYVPRSAQKGFPVGHWPIPESFWPELSASVLPPRTAHPNVKFTCTSQEPLVIENLPFDKYELEPSPLTQYILSRKQPTICWQVFVSNSYKNSEVGHPFGYLKASTNLSCVNMFIMPYNYPQLLPLLDELFKVHRGKPPPEWRMQFNNYLRTMPGYYAAPLRRALHKIGGPQIAATLMPDNMENGLSYSVLNYLKRLKNQAKIEFDRLCNDVGKSKPAQQGAIEGIRVQPRNQLKRDLVSHPLLQEKFSTLREQVQEYPGFMVASSAPRVLRGQSYRNPFDVVRSSLLDQLVRMRANFSRPVSCTGRSLLHDEDEAHSMPVSQMGNYQEYLKRIPAQLREIESAPVRQHMFGNPFKIDKRMMVDEADEADLVSAGGGGTGTRGVKRPADSPLASPRMKNRKPGPIPRDMLVRRPSTPVPTMVVESPPPSPAPSPPLVTPPIMLPVIPPVPSPVATPVISPVVNITPPDPPPPPLPQPTSPPASAVDLDPDVMICEPIPLLPLVNGSMLDDHYPRSPSPPPLDLLNLMDPSPPLTNHVTPDLNHANPPPPPPPLIELTPAEKHAIQRHNIEMRSRAYREVRKPGKDISALLNCLQELKGELNNRVRFVRDVIQESRRFRRKRMADQLEKFLESLMQVEGTTVNGQVHR